MEKLLDKFADKKKVDILQLKNLVRDRLKSYILATTQRKPMIIPVIMQAHDDDILEGFMLESFLK